jgi:hypothetical protein
VRISDGRERRANGSDGSDCSATAGEERAQEVLRDWYGVGRADDAGVEYADEDGDEKRESVGEGGRESPRELRREYSDEVDVDLESSCSSACAMVIVVEDETVRLTLSYEQRKCEERGGWF